MPEQLKAMIVENDPFVVADLLFLLQSHSSVSVITEAKTVEEAKAALARQWYDVIFLDVVIRDSSGFDIIDTVPQGTAVIFIATYPKYAVRAFEVDALDYLIKPVTPERLAVAVNRLGTYRTNGPTSVPFHAEDTGPTTVDDVIAVRCDDGTRFVAIDEIVAINSVGGNYTSIHVSNNQVYIVRKTFKEWETILPRTYFFRIHRQCIVNMRCASAIRKSNSGIWELGLLNISEPLPVSRRALPEVKKFFR